MLTLESFVASIIKRQYRKFGMYPWDNSTIPVRSILLTQKQAILYDNLFRQRINKIEKTKEWNDNTFKLRKNGLGIPSLLHKSGMEFRFLSYIKEKSFCMADVRNNKGIWISNQGHAFLNINYYKPLIKNN